MPAYECSSWSLFISWSILLSTTSCHDAKSMVWYVENAAKMTTLGKNKENLNGKRLQRFLDILMCDLQKPGNWLGN